MNSGEGPSGSQPGGMNPGEGSGSQLLVEPDMKQLDEQIRHMLQYVGFSAPLPGIIPRPLMPPVSHKQNRRTRGQGTRGQGTRGERTRGRRSGDHGSGSGN
uniref:Uncharacterized protein n=1 Tax=Meloidogyne javanica TaxID=6303 RepID=A0A915MT14_MELJA